MRFLSSCIFLLIFPLYVCAHLVGTFEVKGFDPTIGQSYSGTVVISKSNGIYSADWHFDDGSSATGTGVKQEDALAFVFLESNGSTGVQLYEIKKHGLKGPWVLYGGTVRGFEQLTPAHSSSSSSSCH